jgi:parallel beta-helix repeat protein
VTIHVPGDYPTIQAGIDACVDGDTVLVADGTYTGDGNRSIQFRGKAIVVMSENGPDVTIIDCEGAGRGFFFHNGEGSTSVLQGFTITNGYSSGYSEGGGGMYNYYSSPTVTNCTFSANSAVYGNGGGGMLNEYSSPTVTNCRFSGNMASTYGGGMYNKYSSNPTVTNCTFIENMADLANGGGGGMYNYDSNPTVTNCTFLRNSTYFWGGGMYNVGSNPTVTNCTFSANSADYGSGMYNTGDPMVTNCTFSGNSAESGGGMYNLGDPMVTNCTFSDNSASDRGGGIYNYHANPTITNCMFTDNTADYGGGIYSNNESPTVTNCILWGNLGGEIYNNDSNPIVTYCDVEGGYPGEGNIDVPPRFADPEYHLQSTSPCIDAGDPSILDACLPPGLGEERSDMGAYGGEENCGWPEDLIELVIDAAGPVLVTRGDTLFFSTLIRNNSQNSVEGNYWLSVELPSENEIMIPEAYLNYPNLLSGQVAGEDSLTLSNELYVPGNAPTGGYKLIGRVGMYPNAVIDEWWLNFVVAE